MFQKEEYVLSRTTVCLTLLLSCGFGFSEAAIHAENSADASASNTSSSFSSSNPSYPAFVPDRGLGSAAPASAKSGGDKSVNISSRPFSALGIGVNVGTLGIGGEAATPLASRANLRAGFNLFGYSTSITQNGITYNADLTMRSGQVSLDIYPFGGGFRISPGVMIYNGNKVDANLTVPGGQSFTVNSATYYSDAADPLTGSAIITFPKAGPQLSIGWGNMVPRRKSKHFTVPVELGAVYFGTGTTALNFGGSVCSSPNSGCASVASNPTFQSNATAEQSTIQKNLKYARFYPILRFGVAYRF